MDVIIDFVSIEECFSKQEIATFTLKVISRRQKTTRMIRDKQRGSELTLYHNLYGWC
jgi:hypothetical protein